MFIVTKKFDEDNITKVCRTCLREDNEKMLYLFFGPPGSSLGAKLQSLSCLEVYQGDGLPENMCDRCVTRTESALLFREQCRAADRALRQAAYQLSQAKIYRQHQNSLQYASRYNQHNNVMTDDYSAYSNNQNNYSQNNYYPSSLYEREAPLSQYPHIVEPQNANSHSRRYSNETYPNAEMPNARESCSYNRPDSMNSLIRHSSMQYNEQSWQSQSSIDYDYDYDYSTSDGNQLDSYDISNISENNHLEVNESFLQNTEIQTEETSPDIGEDSNNLIINEDDETVSQSVVQSIDNIDMDKITSTYENEYHNATYPNSVIEYQPKESHPENVLPLSQEIAVINHTGPSEETPEVPKNRYKCEICSRLFSHEAKLSTHKLLHSRKKPFECVHCGNRYLSKNKLASHMRLHTKVNIHQCDTCYKIFSYPSYLKEHLKTHEQKLTDRRKPLFECEHCKKQFHFAKSYDRHMKYHTGKALYHCDICDKLLTSKYALKVHIHTHEQAKNHRCDICRKSFNLRSNLVEHIRTHTKVKPYKCKICDKSFVQSSHLKSHIISHNSVRKHECKYCEKKFKLASHLKRHVSLHTGMKMHKCGKCNQVFTQAFSLKRHSKRHEHEL